MEVGAHSGAHFQLVVPENETEIGNIMNTIEETGTKPADVFVRDNANGFSRRSLARTSITC
jgi:hypothetical protein